MNNKSFDQLIEERAIYYYTPGKEFFICVDTRYDLHLDTIFYDGYIFRDIEIIANCIPKYNILYVDYETHDSQMISLREKEANYLLSIDKLQLVIPSIMPAHVLPEDIIKELTKYNIKG